MRRRQFDGEPVVELTLAPGEYDEGVLVCGTKTRKHSLLPLCRVQPDDLEESTLQGTNQYRKTCLRGDIISRRQGLYGTFATQILCALLALGCALYFG